MYRVLYNLSMCYIVLLSLIFLIIYYCFFKWLSLMLKNKIKVLHLIFSVIFGIYILFVLYISIFNRGNVEQSINLNIFWSYQYILKNKSIDIYYEVILNILLYVPFGLLGTNLIKGDNKKNIIKYALLFSALIEVSQGVLCLGLGEVDDIFHNILGCYVGYRLSLIMETEKFKGKGFRLVMLCGIALIYAAIWLYISS